MAEEDNIKDSHFLENTQKRYFVDVGLDENEKRKILEIVKE